MDSPRENIRQADNGKHLLAPNGDDRTKARDMRRLATDGNNLPPSANRRQHCPSLGMASDRHGRCLPKSGAVKRSVRRYEEESEKHK